MANYTRQDQVDLVAVSRHYGLGQSQLEPLKGGAANSSFHLSCTIGDFTLTILDNHDMDSAQRLASHTQAMFRMGVPTTEVIPGVDGSLVTTLDGRPLILKRWVEGEVQEPFPTGLTPRAGQLLARLHQLEPVAEGLTDIPVGTRRLSEEQLNLVPGFEDQEFSAWLTSRLATVRSAESRSERTKAIAHGDLFADNVIVRTDGELAVLDWETVSLDDPLLDLGMAAVGLAQQGGVLVAARLDALVSGYEEVAGPLSEADAAALPVEIEHAGLIIAFHRYYRHHVRFPDPAKSAYHLQMVEFVESVATATVGVRCTT